jgi:hypothetical protein
MDNWHPSIVYDMAIERHREDICRGTAAQRVASQHRGQAPRARLAAALVALAARLDATATLAQREDTALTPVNPA